MKADYPPVAVYRAAVPNEGLENAIKAGDRSVGRYMRATRRQQAMDAERKRE